MRTGAFPVRASFGDLYAVMKEILRLREGLILGGVRAPLPGLGPDVYKRQVWDMWFHVLVAIVPSAVIGLPLDDWMTEHLHNPPVVSAMLILYGV